MKKIISSLIFISTLLCLSCTPVAEPQPFSVIPQPAEVTLQEGVYDIAGADFCVCEDLDGRTVKAVSDFAAQLSLVTGKVSSVETGMGQSQFMFCQSEGMAPESYRLHVGDDGVRVEAGDFNGFFYAIQTLKQMLPVEIYGEKKADAEWVLPCVDIADAPRFSYRGLMLDPARYFWSVEETKRIIDAMALYKLNAFHWHLNDDQGWRWEVKKYPRLTEVGSWRKESCTQHYKDSGDGVPHGGFYTQEELREVVAYAAERGIEVIPEIDIPGHTLAVLAAYPELGCTGGPYEVWTSWGISKDILCPGNPEVFTFIEDVIDELVDIFPSKYIHIGGDECPRERWSECPHCQSLIRQLGLKDKNGVSAEARLQNHVMEVVRNMLKERGRETACWNEAMEGDLDENAVVYAWFNGQLDKDSGAEAVSRGFKTVMCNMEDLYFIFPQNPDVSSEPYTNFRRVTLPPMRVYEYEPFADLEPETEHLVKGVQGCVWCAYMPTEEILEYSTLPRLCALSEVQWCAQDNKDAERFRRSMEHSFRILDQLDYEYYPCLDENPEDVRYKGVYKNYDFDASVINEPAPRGYKPFYITHYGRHGARHINREWEYEAVAKVLNEAPLTAYGETVRDRFNEIYPLLKGRATDLTVLGREQHRRLAQRMYRTWPEVFRGGCHVDAISSDIPRCILSMTSFLNSLEDCSSSIETFADVNSALVPILKKKPVARVDVDARFDVVFDVNALYRRLFTDVEAAKRLYDVHDFMRSLYYFNTHLGCVGLEDELMENVFTDSEASAMAYLDDYKFSHNCGWGMPENVASSWPLLEHFVTMADQDIASGKTDVRLRFGHDNTLMPLLALLKVGVFAERFFDCDEVPMAANLRWVFARNKKGDIIVKIQYNESDMTAWMPWSEFRNFCTSQIEWAKSM